MLTMTGNKERGEEDIFEDRIQAHQVRCDSHLQVYISSKLHLEK